ncbi:MAG TPA: GGDEF domain-containing protein [Planctomycetes bacterium]|nr:GGDEF domain-containing protein [Planctomycetota bacterium]
MTQTASGLPSALIHAENLPSPPAVAVEVLQLTADESVGIEELAQVLARDPALAAKLLKLSNSSLFRRGAEVASLERATMMLGIKTVKLMALSFSLTSHLPRAGGQGSRFDYDSFWRHSLVESVSARSLSVLVKNRMSDEAFLAGLLGRLGQLAMAECMAETYDEVLERSAGDLPEADEERRILGFDHLSVGAALLESWGMPAVISRVVRSIDPRGTLDEELDPIEEDLSWIMRMARATTTVLCDRRKGPALRFLREVATERFGVDEEAMDAFIVGLQAGVAETAALLSVEAPDEPHEDLLRQARDQLMQVSLGAVADLNQTAERAQVLEKEKERLAKKAMTDALTGIPNRLSFDEMLAATLERMAGDDRGGTLGLLILDVDHFKVFNDTHGHAIGDEVLKMVARCLLDVTREGDHSARYGGEEFVVIIPHATDEVLVQVAERVRRRIEDEKLVTDDGRVLSVTVSVGGACATGVRTMREAESLLKEADANLYRAKEDGRNRSVCRRLDRIDVLR